MLKAFINKSATLGNPVLEALLACLNKKDNKRQPMVPLGG
jgi:hypothetical protein